MQTVHAIAELRIQVAAWKRAGERVAFVPTMGNLHRGHIRLVERARELAPRTIASIFVNPMQFGPSEDFAAYPRTLEEDSRQLDAAGLDLLFAPALAEVYPRPLDNMTQVTVPELPAVLCGASRPTHFNGVTTVVSKLAATGDHPPAGSRPRLSHRDRRRAHGAGSRRAGAEFAQRLSVSRTTGDRSHAVRDPAGDGGAAAVGRAEFHGARR